MRVGDIIRDTSATVASLEKRHATHDRTRLPAESAESLVRAWWTG